MSTIKKQVIATLIKAGRPDLANVAATLTVASPAEDLAARFEATVKKHFPKSSVLAHYSSGISNSITISFRLGTKDHWSNGIAHNDPLYANLHIWFGDGRPGDTPKGEVPEKLTIEGGPKALYQKNFSNKVKTGWRKKSGTPDVIDKHLDRFFGKLKTLVRSNTPEGYEGLV